jgi:hypothetical protein
MKYAQLVNRSTQKGYNYSIGKKIRDLMKDLRQRANPHSERRWIWELLQNSKDARYPEGPLHIRINLDTTPAMLEFCHSGQPFTVEQITFLTEQVSSKDRAIGENGEPGSSGKFGDGFLTTHLLSEQVEIDTVIKEPELPYIQCRLLLDRSSTEVGEIIDNVNKSLSVLSGMDDLPPYTQYSPGELNTIFRYRLDEKGLEVARKGLEDLDIAIAYTLLFVPYFTGIEVAHEGLKYRVVKELAGRIGEIELHTIARQSISGEERIEVATIQGPRVQLAFPIKRDGQRIFLQPLHPKVPRLFCDFPLVGTEDFPFPVIINSRLFNPNGPRNRVLLTDIAEKDIDENKSLMLEAVELFGKLIEVCEDERWQHTYLLAAFGEIPELDWVSTEWYDEQVLNPIRDKLQKAVLVDTDGPGRRPMEYADGKAGIAFPDAVDPVVVEKIDRVARQWFPKALPRLAEIHEWRKVVWDGCLILDLETITLWLEDLKTLDALKKALVAGTNVIGWLNEYFELVNLEGAVITEIMANKYAVFPDQNGNFKPADKVKVDSGLAEIFKDIFKSLGEDIRDELRDNRLVTANRQEENPPIPIKHVVKRLSTFYSELNDLLKKATAELALDTSLQLVSLFCSDTQLPPKREKIYKAAKRIFPDSKLRRKVITGCDEKIWESADKIVLLNAIIQIASMQDLEQFSQAYGFPDAQKAAKWLNEFAQLLIEADEEPLLNRRDYPILPNQHGVFQVKDELKSGLFVDDDLKDISEKLGRDYRAELIDDNFTLVFPGSRVIADLDVADGIKATVASRMGEMREDEETREAFRLLYIWLSRNPKEGTEYFGELYVNRYRLYRPEDFAVVEEKGRRLDSLMADNNIADYDELERRVREGQKGSKPRSLLPITEEILVSLGVTSEDEFFEAMKDKNLEELFSHESIPTREMYIFVQAKLRRVRKNVLAFLQTLAEYDCTHAEFVTTSVLGGIRKQGQEIMIVVRPSDNGEVIFYHGSEKDTLEEPGAECWIENDKTEPELLTLGRILKVNKITKVKVR